MRIKNIIFLILFLSPIGIYLIFRDDIKPIWDDIDIFITLSSYSFSAILLLYNLNLKFHFAVNKIFQWFRQDHTYWRFSYFVESEEYFEKEKLLENFREHNIFVNKNSGNLLEIIYKESHLFRLQFNQGNNNSINLFSNKIIVPTKRIKPTINELIEIVESIEFFPKFG